MKKLIVGQIGCGAFSYAQDLPNFANNPHTTVKWCCDISEESAKKAAATFGAQKYTTDFMDVINDPEVDMIKISTSHEVHLPIIEAAAAKGIHIFCEKPMAIDREEGVKIIHAVRKHNIKLCVDLNRRMAPAIAALRNQWIAHRDTPKHQPWQYIETPREKMPEEHQTNLLMRIQDESSSYRLVHLDPIKGGGALIGETIHWLDLACWFFAPAIPVSVQAWGSKRLSHGLNLTFSDGNTATILFNCGGSFDYPKELYEVTHNGALFRSHCFLENNYYGVPGLETEIFAPQNDPTPEIGKQGGLNGYLEKHDARTAALSSNAKAGYDSLQTDKGHVNMLNSFVDSIINDTPSPCDETAGYLSTYLALRAIESINLGQILPIPIDETSLIIA